ncbi:hypothetical protein P3T23_000841 [Paraburkholderia sp. GAS448]
MRWNDVEPIPVGLPANHAGKPTVHRRVVNEARYSVLCVDEFRIQSAHFGERLLWVEVHNEDFATEQGQALGKTHRGGGLRRVASMPGHRKYISERSTSMRSPMGPALLVIGR